MQDFWMEIWNNRKKPENERFSLQDLIELDGFDSGLSKINAADWINYVTIIAQKINLSKDNSLYEVGCGSGAFLYAIKEMLGLTIGGCDYSRVLLEIADYSIAEGKFECIEANKIDTSNKYDFVMANSVFQYFDIEYARCVLESMVKKANKAVCILDVPDIATRDLAEIKRSEALGVREYNQKYISAKHTYYSKSWFSKIASELGFSSEIFPGCIPGYSQNCFRFNVIINK